MRFSIVLDFEFPVILSSVSTIERSKRMARYLLSLVMLSLLCHVGLACEIFHSNSLIV